MTAQPTSAEQAATNEHHLAPTAMQTQHQQAASSNRAMLASENHGTPAVAATPKPGSFKGPGVVAAKPVSANAMNANTNTNGSENHPASAAKTGVLQTDRPPAARTNAAVSTGEASTNANRPPNTSSTVQGNGNHPNTTQTNSSHTSTAHPNSPHPNNPPSNNKPPNPQHTNTSHPSAPKQQSHPAEPHGAKGR